MLSWHGVTVAWTPLESRPSDGREARTRSGDRLLATVAESITGSAHPVILRRCDRCGSTEHGRPRVPSDTVALSVSYSADLVVVAAAPISVAVAVGVDVEAGDGARDLGDELAALFAPRSAPDLAGWTRIEAVLKADGRGLSVPPDWVGIDGSGWARVPDRSDPIRVETIERPEGPDGYVVSVAVVPWATPEAAACPARR